MNYDRIYRELIADRRANPPSENEYAEVHHILPRCMGGGDEVENLIRLIPEDHFFAHLLLAKIHDTASMWGAVMVMHTRKSRSELLLRKTRVAYGFARRRYGKLCSEFRIGEDNPNYNPELVTLKNLDGTVVSLTRMNWVAEYGMKHEWLCSLLSGRIKSSNGWMLPETEPSKTGVRSGKHNVQADIKIRYWRHVDGRVSVATKFHLAELHGLRINDLSAVIAGKHGHHSGWHLDPSRIGWSGKPNRVLGRDDEEYTIYHIDGRKMTGNRRSLAGECGLGQRDISALLLGTRKSAFGWMIKEVVDSGYIPNIKPVGYAAANDNIHPDLFGCAA